MVIVFHSLDASLAYYIKKRLGFGSVKKVKIAFHLVIDARKGVEKVINLINGKIRTENMFYQITNNILSNNNYLDFAKTLNLKLNLNNDLQNHWLAGFSDVGLSTNFVDGSEGAASFQIEVLNCSEVRLNFQIDAGHRLADEGDPRGQNKNNVLLLIKEFLGGKLIYRKSQDTYYYVSTSYDSAKKVISFFDKFHLLSSKHINYLKWRKAYLIIKDKDHLRGATDQDRIKKIIKLKSTMIRLSDTTV